MGLKIFVYIVLHVDYRVSQENVYLSDNIFPDIWKLLRRLSVKKYWCFEIYGLFNHLESS